MDTRPAVHLATVDNNSEASEPEGNDALANYCTIFLVSGAPKKPGYLYVSYSPKPNY
jgi:hypothetical protein